MDILNPRSLREDAGRALARGRDPKKLIFTYAGITLALSVLITVLDLWLEQEISGTGGLGNLGTRAIFSTAQLAAPILAGILATCLELGYLSGIMRIARGQYADHTDLKVGLQKFWPMMRLSILQTLIYLGLGFLAVQLAGFVFAMTPWAEPAMELAMSLSTADPAALTEADLLRLVDLMTPIYVIAGIVYLVILIPFLYKLRFARYCLLDDSGDRALAAIRASFKLTRRRFLALLKIDLSLWYYYLATALMLVLMSADMILPLLGVRLPMDAAAFSLLVYGIALAAQFGIHVTLRNKVEAVYITAYDYLREKPREGGPVVLGNIFDM
jgi:hypothetical protein